MSQIHIDQLRTLSLRARDSRGNIVDFTPDATPVWTFSDQSAIESTVADDGMTVAEKPLVVGPGSTATVSFAVNGAVFEVEDEQPVIAGDIASVEIVETDSAAPPPVAAAAPKKGKG